jgi:DNA-binding NarL/FixJ family response regulator
VQSETSVAGGVAASALILVERREFNRGCLAYWLSKYCSSIEGLYVADVETALLDTVPRAVAAIIGMDPSEQDWLSQQVASLRDKHARLPIMLISEHEQIETAIDLTMRLDLQGYIPMSNSLEIAAAAIRLVVAGGNYFPRRPNVEAQRTLPRHHDPAAALARIAKLSPRERAVLGLLSGGLSNRDIGDRLSISLPMVKSYVHRIIRQLGVGNRTEAALLILAHSPDPAHGTAPYLGNRLRTGEFAVTVEERS